MTLPQSLGSNEVEWMSDRVGDAASKNPETDDAVAICGNNCVASAGAASSARERSSAGQKNFREIREEKPKPLWILIGSAASRCDIWLHSDVKQWTCFLIFESHISLVSWSWFSFSPEAADVQQRVDMMLDVERDLGDRQVRLDDQAAELSRRRDTAS
jgi:hypothetical protein